MGGLPDPIRLREIEPGAPGARGQAWHAGPGGREKLLGAGGCRSFGELFHLRFYNPAVPPTESCSRGGRAPPTTPPAASSGAAQAAWSSSCSFGIFFLPPLLVVFLIHLFFSELEKKKKKSEREPPPAVERARPPEAVVSNFSSPSPTPRASRNFGAAGAQICLPLDSTLISAPRPLALVCNVGATLSRLRPARRPAPGA